MIFAWVERDRMIQVHVDLPTLNSHEAKLRSE